MKVEELYKPNDITADNDVKIGNFIFKKGSKIYSCGSCSKWIGVRDKFCKHCGQKIDWD